NGSTSSAVENGGAANHGGAGACPLREICRQFAVPRACRFGHRALSRHSLLDRAPVVITLVRFHLPLRFRDESTITRQWLINGKYPQGRVQIVAAAEQLPALCPALEQHRDRRVTPSPQPPTIDET